MTINFAHPRFNLCNGSIEHTRALCRRLLEEVFVPHLAQNDTHFEDMSKSLLKGLWPINPFIDVHAYKALTYYLISTAVSNNNSPLTFPDENMTTWSRFILGLQLSVHQYLLKTSFWWSGFFRGFFNTQMRLGIYLTEKFPFLAYWIFGKKQSYFNIYKFHWE